MIVFRVYKQYILVLRSQKVGIIQKELKVSRHINKEVYSHQHLQR